MWLQMNALIAIVALGCLPQKPPPPVYEIEDIGLPEGWERARVICMDSTGSMFVLSNLSNYDASTGRGAEVVIATGEGYETVAPDPDYPLSWIVGILDDGTIFGHRMRRIEGKADWSQSLPFAHGPSVRLKQTISRIDPDKNVVLVAANEKGDIVGNVGTTPDQGSPDPKGGYAIVDGVERIEKNLIFYDINSEGTVLCKQSEYADSVSLYKNGELVPLFSWGRNFFAPKFIPVALNDHDAVAGVESDQPKSLVLFENDTLMRIQGQPVHFAMATDINNRGEVVGKYWLGGGSGPGNLPDADGFLWSDGRMYELGDLVEWPEGWRLTYVHQISEKGDVLVTLQRQSPFREKSVIFRRRRD